MKTRHVLAVDDLRTSTGTHTSTGLMDVMMKNDWYCKTNKQVSKAHISRAIFPK